MLQIIGILKKKKRKIGKKESAEFHFINVSEFHKCKRNIYENTGMEKQTYNCV